MTHRHVAIPHAIATALAGGAALAVSISGGKDSQALLLAVTAEHRRRSWPGPIYAIHAHLGRAEWPQTMGHCERICAEAGVELIVVRRPQGDLVQEIHDRMEKLRGTGKPPWPSAEARYCTSDQKRSQIDKVTRSPWPTSTQRYCTADQKRDQIFKRHREHDVIVAAMGLRADESKARAKRPEVSIQTRTTAKALSQLDPCTALLMARPNQRVALDWLPLLHWSVDDVWETIGTDRVDLEHRRSLYARGDVDAALAGWPAHPAYIFGNDRLSCALCVLASRNDLVNGARHNPELLRDYVQMEQESGFTFRQGLALSTLLDRSDSDPVAGRLR